MLKLSTFKWEKEIFKFKKKGTVLSAVMLWIFRNISM